MVYALDNLKKGDKLHAYMTNTNGNLDPMLGLLIKAGDYDVIHEKILKALINSDRTFLRPSPNSQMIISVYGMMTMVRGMTQVCNFPYQQTAPILYLQEA